MERDSFKSLLAKIVSGSATDAELVLYHNWYNDQLKESIAPEELNQAKTGVSTEIFIKINKQLSTATASSAVAKQKFFISKRTWISWFIAATTLFILGLSYFYFNKQHTLEDIQNQYNQATIDTLDGVILTLENGEQVNLSSSSSIKLPNATAVNLSKEDNLLQYKEANYQDPKANNNELRYNSLYTPNGKTFQIVLADGTKVWLNAKSMLRYPTSFIGDTRTVQLIGEGYFEVKSNPEKPFIVESNGQEVKVLGTKFNISAYSDMATIQSTVVEGKVAVKNIFTEQSAILLAGEQIELSKSTFKKSNVSTRDVLGWKNGYFVFQDAKLEGICKTLSRWYDIEFDLSKNPKISTQRYSGTVVKFNNVEEVLSVLSETGSLRYQREGRRILLMN